MRRAASARRSARRNHAKASASPACSSERAGAELSTAQVSSKASIRSLAASTSDAEPDAADATSGARDRRPDHDAGRTAMADGDDRPAVLPVSNPRAFFNSAGFRQQGSRAMGSSSARIPSSPPSAAGRRARVDRKLRRGALQQPRRLPFHDASGTAHPVRCRSFPRRSPSRPPEELAKRGPNFLEQEIANASRRAAELDAERDRRQSGDPTRTRARPGRTTAARSRSNADVQTIIRGGRALPRHQLRSGGAAERISTSDDPFRRRSSAYRSPSTGARPRRRTIREPRREEP